MISSSLALKWLLTDRGWWLWSSETQREALQLLISLASRLQADEAKVLENAILLGPPREMFRGEIEAEQLARTIDHEIWLRLSKYQEAGAALGSLASEKLGKIKSRYPEWRSQADERDEFPFWMGDVGELERSTVTPLPRRELEAWLREHQKSGTWDRDDWTERCKADFPRAATALLSLARQGEWYADRWRDALQAWADESLLRLSWRHMAQVLSEAPDLVLKVAGHAVGWWLQAQSKSFVHHQKAFFRLVDRLIELHRDAIEDSTSDIVTKALNHPVGHALQATLHWWYRQKLKDDDGLSEDVQPLFTNICTVRVPSFRYGRVLLAANAVSLFRVDANWTRQYLLPLFNWEQSSDEAEAVWKGFLWTPRLFRPLIEEIREDILTTARYYERLGNYGEQYAGFLTYSALEGGDFFTGRDLKDATASLPPDGKIHAVHTMVRALEGAGGAACSVLAKSC